MNNCEYQKNLYKERLDFAIAYLGGVCNGCSSSSNLQFDHIDPSKKNTEVTALLKGNKQLLIEELKLCQLLCNDCHKTKTSRERPPWEHGTIQGANTLYMKQLRASIKNTSLPV